MLCQRCNKKTATVFISTIINGENNQMYLCTDCAKEFHDMNPDMQIPFPINDILSNMELDEDLMNSLLEDLKESKDILDVNKQKKENNYEYKENIDDKDVIRCSICNTSFNEYRRTGKLGCARCYSTFKNELTPIIKDIYGYSDHIGKFPKNDFQQIDISKEVQSLKEQLNIAIQEEEYEQAAKLRDKILELETSNI